jgi:hypothetical protein
MSTLLEQASLVLIPSGYKEDTVYSVIPSNGSGDMSFTRASDGTRINSDGLVENTPWNLMSYSEQFNNAFWNKAASGSATFTVTANQTTAPNGTLTADLITITRSSITELSAIYTSVGQGLGTFKNSIWLKAKDGSNVGKTIDLWSWEGTTRGYTKITLTADWVRYEQNTTVFTTTGAELFDFGLLPSSFSTSTTLAVEFYAWGGQSNIGSTAKPYFPTTDRLNVPRLTYQNGGGGCPSLLLEPQRTNLLTYSEQFNNAAWTLDGDGVGQSVTANYSISPDGTQNAYRLQLNKTGGIFSRLRQNAVGANTYTFTVYMKSNTSSSQNVGLRVDTTGINNVVTTSWQRFTLTATVGTPQAQILLFDSIVGNDETADILIWGAQLEVSSYATSYIKTTSASATRIADACSKTGISSLIGQTEGVLFAEFIPSKTTDVVNLSANGVFQTDLNISYDANNTRIGINFYVNPTYIIAYFSPGGSALLNTKIKVAVAYKSGDLAIYINGVQRNISTTTYTIVSPLTRIRFNQNNFTGSDSILYNQVIIFPNRLSNSELATLTTI